MMPRLLVPTIVLGLGVSVTSAHLHPFGNPWKERPQSTATLLQDVTMPAEAREVLVKKCADCHSEVTRAPFYASLAPGSWLVERDVVVGRAHMNLSRWKELGPERREVLGEEIAQLAKTGRMPPVQYRLLHWDARLSPQDVHALAALQTSKEETVHATQELGDAVRGKQVFERRCTGCHAMDVNREGPRLRDVFRRSAGSVAGFQYSAGLVRSGLTWTPETLDQWLADPDAMVPDNKMSFATPKAADRRDLIAYLQQGISRPIGSNLVR